MSGTTADGQFPNWQPPELGLPRAALAALALVALIGLFLYGAIVTLAPKPTPVVIQVTQAQLTSLPRPTPPPPPPPKVIPPPKPLPAIVKPPPVESKIVVPVKPPPLVHHIVPRPLKRVVVPHPQPPAPPTPPAQEQASPSPTPAPAAPAAAPTSGLPIYGSEMHDIIQANQDVPPALAALGVAGTAVIRITVAPDGHVVSASVARSSGVPQIDQVALDHAMHAHLPPFNANMPNSPHTFLIPVDIEPSSSN